jgi:hypothetical protein
MNTFQFRNRLRYPLSEYVLVDPSGNSDPCDAIIYCLKDGGVTLLESDDASAYQQWMHTQGVPVLESVPEVRSQSRPEIESKDEQMIEEYKH